MARLFETRFGRGGLLAAFVLTAVAPAFGAESRIVAAGAVLQKVAGGFEFTEGPTADAEGNVFFTD